MIRRLMFTGMLFVVAALLFASETKDRYQADEQRIEELKALLNAHDKAFTSHDLDGVLATFSDSEKTSFMGTGPGELWVGKEEIGMAYKKMFESFDPGQQDFRYDFILGGTSGDVAWLSAMGEIKISKGGEERALGMNVSIVMVNEDGNWRFIKAHISTVGGGPAGEEGAADPDA